MSDRTERCPACGVRYDEIGDVVSHYTDGDCEYHQIEQLRRQLAQRPRRHGLAAECHRLAVARGKYPQGWTPGPWWLDGWDIRSEDGEVYDDDEDGGAIGGK